MKDVYYCPMRTSATPALAKQLANEYIDHVASTPHETPLTDFVWHAVSPETDLKDIEKLERLVLQQLRKETQ